MDIVETRGLKRQTFQRNLVNNFWETQIAADIRFSINRIIFYRSIYAVTMSELITWNVSDKSDADIPNHIVPCIMHSSSS